MNKINEIKRNNIKDCQNILGKSDKQTIDDLNTVDKIMLKDNTEPVIIITYLKLLQKFNNKKFLEKIKKYEYFLSKELFNNEFSKVYKKEISSSELFQIVFDKIIKFSDKQNYSENMTFYKNLVLKIPIYREKEIRGYTDYQRNKELTLYILVKNIIKGIAKHINDIKISRNIKEDPEILLHLMMLDEAKKLKKVEDYDNGNTKEAPTPEERKLYEDRKDRITKDLKETINDLEEEINIRNKIYSKEFITYFSNFKNFLAQVKENFNNRFENIENLKDNDFILLKDFCLYLQHYDFLAGKDINIYVIKWNNTFTQTKEDIQTVLEQNTIKNLNEYYLMNDDLILKVYNLALKQIQIVKVKNINKYCINCIVPYLTQKYVSGIFNKSKVFDSSTFDERITEINEYDIEFCLKFDCIEDIYINKNWNIFENHLIKIFSSQVIKSALAEINKTICISGGYDFLNEDDLRILFRRARIFQFPTNFYGITEPTLLSDYIYYKGNVEAYKEERSKLSDLSSFQITQEHEMLGHINIRLQNYLSEKEILSPISNYTDSKGNQIKEKESGIYIENLLYGRRIDELNLNEILFVLDEENYEIELDVFRKKFKECKEGRYEISKTLSILLDALNIIVTDKLFEDDKSKENLELTKKSFTEKNVFKFYSESHNSILHPDPRQYRPFERDLCQEYKWLLDPIKNRK